MSDWLSSIRLHHESIDWSDATHTAASLTTKMMGPVPYLRDLRNAAGDFKNAEAIKEAAQREIALLKSAGYSRWGGRSEWKPLYQHLLTLMKLLMPRRDITLNLADIVMFFCTSLTKHQKILNLIGSQNSGKTSALAQIALSCLAISPNNTAVYLATPHDKAGDSTLWGDLLTAFYEIQDSSPWLWPGTKPYAAKFIKIEGTTPKGGLIEYRGVKDVGKFMGMKTVKSEPGDPLLLVGIDEVNRISSQAFLDVLANLVSQRGFMTVTSQNFSDETSMGGILTAPHKAFPGHPAAFSDLDKDTSDFWYNDSGVTLRFNGLKSPNILSGRDIYPYLFTNENLALQIKKYTVRGLKYYEQVLSFPFSALGEATVLDSSSRESSRYKDLEFSIDKIDFRASFLDPAFSGEGDKAIYTFADFGTATSVTSDGRQREKHPLALFTTHMVPILIDIEAVVDEKWLRKMHNIGADISQWIPGNPISVDDQLAVETALLNMTFHIPSAHCGYDFSMRAKIVVSMNNIVGRDTVPFSYNHKPEGIWLENFKGDSADECTDRCSELAFWAANFYHQKQIRGGEFIEAATYQLCRTRYEIKSKKHKVESKKEYKARYQGHSPDERDGLMGLFGMAHKLGFRPSIMANPVKNSLSSYSGFSNPQLRSPKIARLPT